MSCSTLFNKRCQFIFVTTALACLVFPRLDFVGWRKRVTQWCSLATRTLDRVLIAGVAAGKFIFAVRCERLLRRLRRRAVGESLSLFGVWLFGGVVVPGWARWFPPSELAVSPPSELGASLFPFVDQGERVLW